MKSNRAVFSLIFLLTLLASGFSHTTGATPQNGCLMIPEILNGQSAANEYNPDSCIASANKEGSEFLAINAWSLEH